LQSRNNSLFLSPHPDDLAFSAFSALIRNQKEKNTCITFFNISSSTRWGRIPHGWANVPEVLTSILRTFEDRLALVSLGLRSKYLNMSDSKAYQRRNEYPKVKSLLGSNSAPDRIYAPLGVGAHPDHIYVREFAFLLWNRFGTKPKLLLYEDLPYSFYSESKEANFDDCIQNLQSRRKITANIVYELLSREQFLRKMRILKFYFSQMDDLGRERFLLHARNVGREVSTEFAERYVHINSLR
jgi:LmbE family N-acetylglucosaminyl deacetylase